MTFLNVKEESEVKQWITSTCQYPLNIVVKMSFEGQISSSTDTHESMKVTVLIQPCCSNYLSEIVLFFQNNYFFTLSVEGYKHFKRSIYSHGMDQDQEADIKRGSVRMRVMSSSCIFAMVK